MVKLTDKNIKWIGIRVNNRLKYSSADTKYGRKMYVKNKNGKRKSF